MKKSFIIPFLCIIALLLPLTGYSEDMKDLIKECEGYMGITGVSDDDYKDDNGNEFIFLKFEATLARYLPKHLNYAMRVGIQVTDKKTDTVIYSTIEKKTKPLGENSERSAIPWGIKIPAGDMKRPKITAYAVELGILQDDTFIPVKAQYDEVDSFDEISSAGGSEVNTASLEQMKDNGRFREPKK